MIDQEKTIVIFRKYPKEKDIIALFPELGYPKNTNNPAHVMSYMHIGQHGEANYYGTIDVTVLATLEEYKDLTEELTSIGYNLTIKKKYIKRRKK